MVFRDVLAQGRVDMCFVRLPIDRAGLHAIPLYHEVAVAVVQKEGSGLAWFAIGAAAAGAAFALAAWVF